MKEKEREEGRKWGEKKNTAKVKVGSSRDT